MNNTHTNRVENRFLYTFTFAIVVVGGGVPARSLEAFVASVGTLGFMVFVGQSNQDVLMELHDL